MKKTLLLSTAAATATLAALTLQPTSAQAEDCILSTNNNDMPNGRVGANSNAANDALACGRSADATGDGATAVGANTTANATNAIA